MSHIKVYVTACLNMVVQAPQIHINLLGVGNINVTGLMTSSIVPGQTVIFAIQENKRALYILNKYNRPHQVYGIRDILLNATHYENLINHTMLKKFALLQDVFDDIFQTFTLKELEEAPLLSSWEWISKEEVLLNKTSNDDIMNILSRNACEILEADMCDKICTYLTERKHKVRILQPPFVDWGDYNITSHTNWLAID